MNIGIVSYWFNRGQGTVGRYIRSLFNDAGHKTYVLARPTKDKFVKSNYLAENDVWCQDGVTPASNFIIPYDEYLTWVKDNRIEVIFCDQNYQFDELFCLRKMGILTIGRFVWESFGANHIEGAEKAFDVIYSLTQCEQRRYQDFGIQSPYLRWGIHPELLAYQNQAKRDYFTFFYPGGYLSPRKPTGAVIEAFSRVPDPDIRLIIKTQNKLQNKDLIIPVSREQTRKKHISEDDPVLLERSRFLNDNRICVVTTDMFADDYFSLFASCHICLAPSRWEGLGLHLYEAIGFGLPIITNDNPPMNEMVVNNKNGYLVQSSPIGPTRSGIEAFEPDIEGLAKAITYFTCPHNLKNCVQEILAMQNRFRWQNTIEDFRILLLNLTSTSFL
jgi:1,2-diacylglycerol 3-alpha-glucosyltransferase